MKAFRVLSCDSRSSLIPCEKLAVSRSSRFCQYLSLMMTTEINTMQTAPMTPVSAMVLKDVTRLSGSTSIYFLLASRCLSTSPIVVGGIFRELTVGLNHKFNHFLIGLGLSEPRPFNRIDRCATRRQQAHTARDDQAYYGVLHCSSPFDG